MFPCGQKHNTKMNMNNSIFAPSDHIVISSLLLPTTSVR